MADHITACLGRCVFSSMAILDVELRLTPLVVQVARNIMRHEGMAGLYKGLSLNWLKAGHPMSASRSGARIPRPNFASVLRAKLVDVDLIVAARQRASFRARQL